MQLGKRQNAGAATAPAAASFQRRFTGSPTLRSNVALVDGFAAGAAKRASR